MKLVDAHARLLQMKQPVLQTADVAACLKISNAHASKLLSRLAESGHIVRLRRGRWAFPERVDPLALPEYLTDPFPSYVSLQSALYYHGMISQIPVVTYAVSLGRTRRFETPLGTVSIHHVHPSFFAGFETTGKHGIKIATPEKALLDIFYLSSTKSKLFRCLPEIELPKDFSIKKWWNMVRRIGSRTRRTSVANSFKKFMYRAQIQDCTSFG